MFIPVIMIVMIFGMASVATYCQEEPQPSSFAEATEEGSVAEAAEPPTVVDAEPTPEEKESAEAPAEPAQEIETKTEPAPETTPAETPSPETPSENTTSEQSPEESTPIEDVEKKVVIPEEETVAVEEEPEPTGIDTVSLENPQGNWLFKRIWWERAEERYEKIRQLVDAVWESRNTFFHERNQLDRTVLNPFYMNIGIDRGELQAILSEIGDFLEKHRDREELTEQERILTSEEETLKQLKNDIDMIASLDQAIDDALGTFMNQINRIRSYEAEAWKNFTEIAHILNDTRARELYYMIEGAARNIKSISMYLEQEFFTHFHKLVDEAKTRVARVQSQMEALKEKGVLFQKQAEQIEQQVAQEEIEQEEETVKPKPKVGWLGWISAGISSSLEYIWSIIRLPYDLIFGK